MEVLAYLSLLLVLSILLVKSADQVEAAFVLVAHKLGISTFVIGFVVLSIASSLPEASVALSASIEQVPGLSLGNLLGATIVLLTLVTGINAMRHKQIAFKGKFGVGQVIISLMLLTTMLMIVSDGYLTAGEGILACLGYALLVIYIIWHGNKNRHLHEEAKLEVGRLAKLLVRAALGVVGLMFISKLIVDVAIFVANDLLFIPPSVVGLLVLAIGTNIPELAIAFRANGREAEAMSVGNLLGSSTVNVLILGMLSIFSPYQITSLAHLVPSTLILGAAILLFAFMAWTGRHITRQEGYILLGVYLSLLLAEGFIIYQSSAGGV